MATDKARRKTSDQELIQRALEKARTALEEKGVAGAAQLGAPRLRSLVAKTLQEEGFELSGKRVRLPLRAQLLDLIATGAHTPLTQLAKRLSGTTTAEAKKLASQLSERGDAQLVLRDKVLTFIPPTEATLKSGELKKLAADMNEKLKWLKKALNGKPPAGILVSDLQENLAAWHQLASTGPLLRRQVAKPAPLATTETNSWALVQAAVHALAHEETGLARVPEVSRRLHAESPLIDLKSELLEAYKKGLVELRPEGGIGRLSVEEATLCPAGAGGIPLSWIRLIEVTHE